MMLVPMWLYRETTGGHETVGYGYGIRGIRE